MLLTLPRLSPEIPAVLSFGETNVRQLMLARGLRQSGLIGEQDIAALPDTLTAAGLRQLIELAFRRNVESLFSFRQLGLEAVVCVSAEDNDDSPYGGTDDRFLCVEFHAHQYTEIACGKALSALNALHPGLGRWILDKASALLIAYGMPNTPDFAEGMASFLHWRGHDNEREFLEELAEEEGEDFNPDEYDILTRDALFDGIPAWAYERTEESLSRSDVEALVGQPEFAPFVPLLQAALDIDRLLASRDLLVDPPDEYGECAVPPAALCWQHDDQLCRLYDDHCEYIMQGETPPYNAVLPIDLSTKGFPETMERLRHNGHLLQALDCLLVEFENIEGKDQ